MTRGEGSEFPGTRESVAVMPAGRPTMLEVITSQFALGTSPGPASTLIPDPVIGLHAVSPASPGGLIGSPSTAHPHPIEAGGDHIGRWLTSSPTRQDLYQFALIYRELGWRVFPVADKKPVCRWKRFQYEPIPLWLSISLLDRPGVTGLAVMCGWVSGWRAVAGRPARKLCVRDFDTVDGYRRWADRYPEVAAVLPTVRTARGFHIYLWSPYEINRRIKGTWADGELKASSKAYVLAPPSQHPSGGVYAWVRAPSMDPDALPTFDPRAIGLLPDKGHNRPLVSLIPMGGVTHVVCGVGEHCSFVRC
jgi:hypothetical protein